MKHILVVLTLTVLLASCNADICKQTVTYTKATAIYGNMDEIRNETVNSAVQQIENPGKIYVGEDFLLIGEENKGIHVVDNSDPKNPTQVNFINIHGIFYDWNSEIIPASSVPASFAGSSTGAIGTVNRLAYTDDHLYIINRTQLFTLADGIELELLNKEYAGWAMETLYPHEDHLFIGTESGMLIYSLDNSESPQFFADFDHAQACDPVLPKGDVAYVTLRSGSECQGFTNELDVVDISNLASPSLAKVIQLDSPYGMSVSGDILYVGQGVNGISMLDISDDLNPQLIHQDRSVEAYDIISHPTDNSRILIAGTDGIDQYQIGDDVKDLTLVSKIQY